MNLEYKITFQDDLDAEETRNEYSFNSWHCSPVYNAA